MRYAIYFTWMDDTEDSYIVESASDRDFNIADMLKRCADFKQISYCKIYSNGEYGRILKIL